MSDGILVVCPIMPSPDGPGLAMRADRIVRALARRGDVHLRVIPLQDLDPHAPPAWPPGLRVASRERVWTDAGLLRRLRFRRVPECARLSPRLANLLRASTSGLAPRVAVILRHYHAPLGLTLRQAHPRLRIVLDLDELESHTRERIVALHRRRGEHRAATSLARQAAHFRHREQRDLSRVDQLWVSSPIEADRVDRQLGLGCRVVPNTIDCPPVMAPDEMPPGAAARRTLLFIGSLGFLPNRDAVEWCAREILPLLRVQGTGSVVLRAVGRVPPAVRRRLGGIPGLVLAGPVASLAPEYQRADLCVVPLRAGGGTRIKLLEALAYGRPVVTTRLGAEGLELQDGRELLVADEAADFAAACARVLEHSDLACDLARDGRARVAAHYGADALDAAVGAALDAVS